MRKIYSLLLTVVLFLIGTIGAKAQFAVTTNSSSGLAATYTSLANAITALNGATITAPVIITCPTGTETAPIAGYNITATGTATNTILIQGNGAANSVITAFTPQASGVKTDAIFKIVGGDYITIQGFKMQENAANTTTAVATNNMTEIGVGLWLTTATNGAQNNTIQNNTIQLGSTYQNAIGIFSSSASSSTNGTLAASATTGTNSSNKFYSNIITNVAYGMYFISPAVTATIFETGIDVGGTSAGTGNTITFGNVTTSDIALTSFSATNEAGIYFRNNMGNTTRYNSITSSSLAYGQTNGVNGIIYANGTAPAGVTYTTTNSNNTINLTNTGTTSITGIDFGSGLSTGTMAGSTNTMTLTRSTTATNSAAVIGIKANYAAATSVLSSNNITINETLTIAASTTLSGLVTGITMPSGVTGTPTMTANSNTILINQNTAVSAGTATMSGTIIGIQATGATTTMTIGAISFGNTITVKQGISGAGTSTYSGAVTYIDGNATHATLNVVANTLNTTASTIRSTGTLKCINQDATISVLVNVLSNTATVDRVAASGTAYFHYTSGTPSEVADTISNNTITFTGLAGTTAAYGIYDIGGPISGAKNVNNNTIGISGTNTGQTEGITTGYGSGNVSTNTITISGAGSPMYGLDFARSYANTLNVRLNNITLTNSTVGTTNTYGILESTNTGSGPFQIFNNTISIASTGGGAAAPSVIGIFHNNGTAGTNIYSNTFTSLSTSGAGGTGASTIYGIYNGSSAGTLNIYSNTISSISLGATTATTGIGAGITVAGGAAPSVYSNNISGISATPQAFTAGLYIFGGITVNAYSNTVSGSTMSTTAGTMEGIYIGGGTTVNAYSNTINNLSTSTASAVIGMGFGAATTINAYKNKIYNLSSSNASGAIYGAYTYAACGATTNFHNNYISDLRNPSASSASYAVVGYGDLSTTASTTQNVYYNTIYLNATSSGTNFATTGMFHTASATATTGKLDLRNNIVINLSTPNGTGVAAALAQGTATATYGNYATTSNNNLLYAGTPSSTHVIMNDFGTGYSTFGPAATAGTFQNAVSTRESVSFTAESGFTYSAVNDFFIDPTASPADLHLKAGITTQCESGAQTIAGYTFDYDGQTRPNNATTTLSDVGADEFVGTSPAPAITVNSFYVTSTTTAGTTSQCAATARDVSVNVTTPAGTITSVNIQYFYNGTSQGTFAMANPSGSTYTYTIPAPTSPTNATVTWSVTATNSLTISTTYSATPYSYSDVPTFGMIATVTPTPGTVCSGSTTNLSVVVTKTAAGGSATIGSGISVSGASSNNGTIFPEWFGNGRQQYIILASELTAQGFVAGNLTGVSVNISSIGTPSSLAGYTMKIGATAATSFASATFLTPTFTTVYGPSAIAPATGTFAVPFSSNFAWDGTSNIVVEICFGTGTSGTSSTTMTYTTTGFTSVAYYYSDVTAGCGQSATLTSAARPNMTFTGTKSTTYTPTAYSWSDGSTVIGTLNPQPASPTNATAGPITVNYTATATVSGCPVVSAATPVTVNPLPTAPGNISTTPQCGNPTYTASTAVPSPTFHFYSAASGGTLLATNTTGSYTAGSFTGGTNTVWVSVNNGTCESPRTQLDVTVNTPDPIAAQANGSATPAATCFNTAIALSAVQTGSTNTYTYTWTCTSANAATGGISGSVTGNPVNVTPTAAGSYTYLVTAVDGPCTTTSSVTIVVNTPPTILSATATPSPVCTGGTVTLTSNTSTIAAGTASDIGTATTLTGATTYPTAFGNRWYQDWHQMVYTAAELQAAGLRAGNITSLAFNISAIGSSATVNNYTVAIGTTASTTLSGFTTTGLTTVYGPTNTSTAVGWNTITFTTPYNWDGTSNLIIDLRALEQDLTNNATTYYTATAGNTLVYAYTTTNNTTFWTSSPTPTTSTSRLNIRFAGQIATIGAGSLNWTWSDGASTVLSANTGTVTANNPGSTPLSVTYTVTGTDPATTCSSSLAATAITVNPLPTAPGNISTTPQCGNPTYTASTSVPSPTFHFYSAASGGTLLATNTTGSYTAGSFTGGTNTVWVSVNNGTCESPRTQLDVTVNTPDPIAAQANGSATPAATCFNTAIALSAVQTGSTNTYTYTWTCTSANAATGGISGSVTGNPVNVTPTAAGSYTYLVTAVDGPCTTTSSVTIVVNTPPTILSATATPSPVCTGGTVTLTSNTSTIAAGTASDIGTATTLTGATTYPTAFGNRWYQDWHQMVYTAAELQAAGLRAGNITSLAFNISAIGSSATVNNYTVAIGTTASTTLSGFTTTGLTTVYGPTNTSTAVGWNTITFTTPYNWDGTSNLIIDLRALEQDLINNATTYYTATAGNTLVYAYTTTNNTTFWTSSPTPTTSTSRLNIRFAGQIATIGAGSLNWTWSDGASTVLSANTGTVTANNPGSTPLSVTYTVTGTDPATTCSSSLAATAITVNPLPVTPTDLSASGTATGTSYSTIGGSFAAASTAPTGYVVVRTATNSQPSLVDNTTYTVGNATGIGYIEYVNTAIGSWNSTGLLPCTTYYYWVFSYNSGCSGIIKYSTSATLIPGTTQCCPTFNSIIAIGGSTTTPGSLYPNLTSAISALSTCGISQPTVLELNSSYDYTTETYPLVLNGAISGQSGTNTITIRPGTGVTASIISNNTTATVDVNAGKYWIIDGRQGGAGSTAALTVSNTSTATGGMAIRFTNDAQNNTVEYITAKSLYASTTTGVITFTGVVAAGNNNNTVTNCNIDGGAGAAASPTAVASTGIYSNGTATYPNTGNTISNNNIFDYYNAGSNTAAISLNANNSGWTITGNRIYQTATRTATSGNMHRGIYISSTAGGGYTVSNNVIGYANAAGTGTMTYNGGFANRLIGIDFAANTTTASSLQGNTVSNIALVSTSGATTTYGLFTGIYISAGAVNVGTVTGNTIGSGTATGAITLQTTTAALVNGISVTSTGTASIQNNTVGGISTNSNTIGYTFYGIYTAGSAGNFTVSSNNVGGTAADAIRMGTSGTTTGATYAGGIYLTNTGSQTISANTVNNLSAYSSNATTCNTAGITSYTAGSSSVTSNTISNLTTNSVVTLTFSAIGISMYNPIGSQTVAQNTIFAIRNTSTTSTNTVTGILLNNASSLGGTVSRNKVYDLTATGSGSPSLIGIENYYGNWTIQNNMISVTNGSNTNAVNIIGLDDQPGSTASTNLYFNSIYVGGTATGAISTTCYNRVTTYSPTVLIKNNIFVNARTGGTGVNYAVANGTTTTGWTSSNNVYNSPTTTMGLWNGAAKTFATWCSASGESPTTSYSGITATSGNYVTFVSPAAGDLHVTADNNCILDGNGVAISGITGDYDNDPRGTPPDIGADELTSTFTFVTNTVPAACGGSVDITAPAVTSGSTSGVTLTYYMPDGTTVMTAAAAAAISTSGTYYIKAVKGSCSSTKPVPVTINVSGQWLGVDNNWFNSANWCGGLPTASTSVVIPGGMTNYPIISSGNAVAGSISIATSAGIGGIITVNGGTSGGILSINGAVTTTGTGIINATAGTINLGATAAVIQGTNFTGGSILNLTVGTTGGSATVQPSISTSNLVITGMVNFLHSGNTLNTGGFIEMASSGTGTASIGDITHNPYNAALLSGNTINGQVTVDRWIGAPRKWDFLSSNATTTSVTVQNSWMEGQAPGTAATPALTGLGMWLTGVSPATGFDAASPAATMKWWNGTTYTGITDPTAYNIHLQPAYMTYVRGDRYATGANSLYSTTNLRIKGSVNINNFPSAGYITQTSGNNDIAIGNPYASAVDLSQIFTNTPGSTVITIKVWDPILTSGNGQGAFQTLRRDVGTYGTPDFYVVAPGGGSYPSPGTIVNTLESGQAFFLQSSSGSNIDTRFTEVSKTPNVRQIFFTAGHPELISASLSISDANGLSLMDGFEVRFKDTYNSGADFDDARKSPNSNEAASVKTNNVLLSGELRGVVATSGNDTVHINMSGIRVKDYQWKFNVVNMDEQGRAGFLVDQFLGTETALNLDGMNTYNFSSTGGASAAADRFMIVFKPTAVVPVTLTAISASRQADKTIAVKWKVENEINIGHYEVQRSANGISFTTIGNNQAPSNNAGGAAQYSLSDLNPLSADNYYRIKAISNNGQVQYSAVVKVGPLTKEPLITIYPNPVSDGVFNVKFVNKPAGTYQLQLTDKAGRTIYTQSVKISSDNEVRTINMNRRTPAGSYDLVIIAPDGKREVEAVVFE